MRARAATGLILLMANLGMVCEVRAADPYSPPHIDGFRAQPCN